MSKNQPNHEDKIKALILEIANRFSEGKQRREIMDDLEAIGCPSDFANKIINLGEELKKELFRNAAKGAMIAGVASAFFGGLITWATYLWASSSENGGYFIVAYGAIVFGILQFGRGLINYLRNLPNAAYSEYLNDTNHENYTAQPTTPIKLIESIQDKTTVENCKFTVAEENKPITAITLLNLIKSDKKPDFERRSVKEESFNNLLMIIISIIIAVFLISFFSRDRTNSSSDKDMPKQSIAENNENQQPSITKPVEPQADHQQPTPNKKLFGLAYQGLSECRAIKTKAIIIEVKRNVDSGLIEAVIYNDGAKRIAYIMLDTRYDAIDAAIIDNDLTTMLAPNAQIDLNIMICKIDEKVWVALIDGIESQYY